MWEFLPGMQVGKGCQFLSAISCQGHEQQILISSRTFRHQPE